MSVSYTPSGQRNSPAIVELLQRSLGANDRVFEIGAGTLQHAALAKEALPGVHWQPSEHANTLAQSLQSWARLAPTDLLKPIVFMAGESDTRPLRGYDVVLTINTLHIMPGKVALALFADIAPVLRSGARLIAYGPMQIGGGHISEGNARFDEELRSAGAGQSIPDIAELNAAALKAGWLEPQHYLMPANNSALVWTKR